MPTDFEYDRYPMAQYDRPPKTKAREPDDFVSLMDHLVRYFIKHRNKFYLLVALCLVGLAGLGIYRYRTSQKLTAIADQYTAAEKASGGEDLKQWEQILNEKPPRSMAHVVAIQIASILGKQDKWLEAAQSYFKSSQAPDPALKLVGQLAYATSLENAKECGKAMEVYKAIADAEKNPFRYDGQLGMARCQLASGQAGEAEMILYQLISNKSEAGPAVKAAAVSELVAMKL